MRLSLSVVAFSLRTLQLMVVPAFDGGPLNRNTPAHTLGVCGCACGLFLFRGNELNIGLQ